MKTSLDWGALGIRLPDLLNFPLRWIPALRNLRIASKSTASPAPLPFALEPGTLWRIDGAVRGLRIECQEGHLWLTQSGRAADVVLGPGRRIDVEEEGSILVQPLRNSSAAVSTALGWVLPGPGDPQPMLRQIHRSVTLSRIGCDLIPAVRGEFWEQMAWTAIWISGGFTVAWWLKAVVTLPWLNGSGP